MGALLPLSRRITSRHDRITRANEKKEQYQSTNNTSLSVTIVSNE
jgi:hypothetical protein